MSKLKHNTDVTPLRDAATKLGSQLRKGGASLIDANMTQATISLESMQEGEELSNYLSRSSEVETVIRDVFATVANDRKAEFRISQEGMEAATITAMAYGDAKAYAARAKNIGIEGDFPRSSHASGDMQFRKEGLFSLEAFDNTELQKGVDISVAFNALAIGQSKFNDLWFGPVVGTPDQVNFRISVPRILVHNEYIPANQSGDPADFGKKNLIRAALDYTILLNNSTDLVPIVRDGVNTDKFVDAALVAKYSRKVGAVTVDTAPLAIGVEASLLNLSANEDLRLAGVVSETDAVEPKVSLDELFIGVAKDDDVQAFRLKVKNLPLAGFAPVMERNIRATRLTFESDSLKVKPTKTDVSGGTLTALADLATLGYSLVLGADVSGRINLETSNVKLFSPDEVRIVDVVDADGKSVIGQADVTAALEGVTFSVLGYTLDARRTNSNLRSKGLILNPDMETRPWYVPLNAPIVTQTPVGQENTGLDLNALVQAVQIQIENAAVTTLLEYNETLREQFISSENVVLYPSTEAIAELMVAPFYEHITIDMELALNSVKSSERVQDIQGVLNSTIREVVGRMFRETGYEIALKANNGGGQEKATVIGVTDYRMIRYLITTGDDRYLGLDTGFEMSSVADLRMRDTIFLSFGRKNTGKHDPLTFGNLLYIPELAISAQVNRNGATIFERQAQPRFRHVVNLPILVKITINKMEEASQDATGYLTRT